MTGARPSLSGVLAAMFGKKQKPAADGYREQLSTNTRFFRNYAQLVALARTVAAYWPVASSLDVLHVGGSVGCEAISFLIAMHEFQPSYQLRVTSTDVNRATLEEARRLRFGTEYFTPILGSEGGNPNGWREKWFTQQVVDGKIYYTPVSSLTQALRFERMDLSQTQLGIGADVVFCQNVLIHMQPELARRALSNAMAMLRSRGLFVCAGMDLDLKAMVGQQGLEPVTDSLREIHEAWESQRIHARPESKSCYLALEDLDLQRPDWAVRYSSIFLKP